MQNNITLCNVSNGQIVSKRIAATQIPDELIRDGWVEVHREAIPKIKLVVQGGEVRCVYSDKPALDLDIVDLDQFDDPAPKIKEVKSSSQKLFKFEIKPYYE